MPKINVYLPDDLADAVKDAGIPISAVCQRALEQAVRRVTAIREIAVGTGSDIPAGAVPFTARAMAVMHAARAAASTDGLPEIGPEHLLDALLDDSDSIAVRVLTALDITAPHVRAELDRRTPAFPRTARGPGQSGKLSASAARVVELAANESSGLGNSYLGTEHLLLGLIGEPDGVAGHALRSLGADLRVTRRTVAAALAGWAAGTARAAQQDGTASHAADQVAAVVRAELAPVLARIERLENRATG